MKPRDLALLFLLAGMWGASFLFIRVAVPVLGPFPLVLIRVLLAGIVLLVAAAALHQRIDWRTHWRRFLIIGAINNAIPFVLISFAQLTLTASFASMLNATTPLWSALAAALWIGVPITAKKVVGLLLGLVGVALILGWRPEPLDAAGLLAAFASLGAALSYGVSSVYSRKAFAGVPPLVTATGQLFAAGLWVAPFAMFNPPTGMIRLEIGLAMAALAIMSTSFGYLLYFRLIATAGATPAASVTFLVPFFSSLWGALFLSETLGVGEVVGFGVILIGLVLVTGLALPTRIMTRSQFPYRAARSGVGDKIH